MSRRRYRRYVSQHAANTSCFHRASSRSGRRARQLPTQARCEPPGTEAASDERPLSSDFYGRLQKFKMSDVPAALQGILPTSQQIMAVLLVAGAISVGTRAHVLGSRQQQPSQRSWARAQAGFSCGYSSSASPISCVLRAGLSRLRPKRIRRASSRNTSNHDKTHTLLLTSLTHFYTRFSLHTLAPRVCGPCFRIPRRASSDFASRRAVHRATGRDRHVPSLLAARRVKLCEHRAAHGLGGGRRLLEQGGALAGRIAELRRMLARLDGQREAAVSDGHHL